MSSNRYFIFSLFVLFIYILPWIIFAENSYIKIHDFLDSTVSIYKTLIKENVLFLPSNSPIYSFMDAPRSSLGTEFDLTILLYYFFEPFNVYIINQIVIRVIAFLGMFLLLKNYILIGDKKYSYLVSLMYSLLPFYVSYGISVAGLPLITYVFLNFRNRNYTKYDLCILILFPFYSSFILSLFFFIIILFILWLYDLFNKIYSKEFTVALIVFLVLCIFINYRLFETFFFDYDFISHRVERLNTSYGFLESFIKSLTHFINGQYHVDSIHKLFLPLVIIVIFKNIFSKNRDKLLLGLFLFNLVISFWYGFWKYEGWNELRETYTFLGSFNFSRFHFLTPLIWYIIIALTIKYYIKYFSFKYKKQVISILISLSILNLFYHSEFIQEYKKRNITYKEFFAEEIFKSIDQYIDLDKKSYKTMSIGFHPSVAIYNGFSTIDGYLANYSLEYKDKFRKIISKELEKSNRLKKVFDEWGNRCYAFSSDIGYNLIRKKDEVFPIHIDFNMTIAKGLGVEYIFSSYKIMNEKENNLKFLKKFEDKDSAWDIYLYKIMESK